MEDSSLLSTLEPRILAIFGSGVSGRAVQRVCAKIGVRYEVFDDRGGDGSGHFGVDDVERFDAFVFSPGFKSDHPWRQLAEASDRLCFCELGFGAWLWQGRMIGVTGTNGKTSVTGLLQQSLECAGFKAVAVGNIGYPLCEAWLEYGDDASVWAVCEVSSFQAELPLGLELDALLWTNFAEDHLDRYPTMDAYFDAKAKLLDYLDPSGPIVLGESVLAWRPELAVHLNEPVEPFKAELIITEGPFRYAPQNKNYALAAQLWGQLGLSAEYLYQAASRYELASHRCQRIGEIGDVEFWDDSKATNFHAALAALQALQVKRPIVWIGGGQSKGGDVSAFAESVLPLVDAMVLYGEAGVEFANELEGQALESVAIVQDFTDAVDRAHEIAQALGKASVLLSPGFSSFDQFASYQERGECFISRVLSLKARSSAH